MHGNLELWLGGGAAAQHFDPTDLAGPERARWARLRRPERRQEFAVSRALRAHARTGRPQSASESLSHSGGFAAFARAHPALRIGVDLELHRARDGLAIARNTFAESEARALEAHASPQRERLFYAMWTVKEALAKALQLPLLEALRCCEVSVADQVWRARIPTSAAGCIRVYEPQPNLTLAVACIGGTPAFEIWDWPPRAPASWPLIAAISLAGAGAPSAADRGSAGAAPAAPAGSGSGTAGSSGAAAPARPRAAP
jgi:phosphopantetheinyl transferase (holo-ACP synthase)